MYIRISLAEQTLTLYGAGGEALARYPVSTAARGAGEIVDSFCTPRGRHLIRAKIGASAPENAVFVRRRPTGEIWTPELHTACPGRDWILTRILWLSGLEAGKNRLGNVDTMRRYIYLHGTPPSTPLGVPGSQGCIRMKNTDIIKLFATVPVFTEVDIVE